MTSKAIPTYMLFFFIGGCCLSLSCQPKVDRDAIVKQLMDEAYEKRVNSYKEVRANRCREGLLREANRLVDSILYVEAKLANDTIDRPPMPFKPIAPEKKILEDTTPVKPFLPDTLQQQIQ